MRRSLFLSQLTAGAAVALWSSAYVFTKVALGYYSVSALALLRCAVASVCLGTVLVLQRKSFPGAAAVPLFFVSGAAGFALYILAFNKGSETLNPTTCCILISTAPIITALLARVWFRETLARLQWAAICMAFCGILVMTLWDGELAVSGGAFWALAAAVLMSVYNIVQRFLTRRFEPLLVTAYSFFAATLLLAPFLPEAVAEIRGAAAPQVWLVVFLGICPSAAAYLLWAKALSLAPSTGSVANYLFLTPFLALLLEYVVTGGLPGGATFVGGAVIMASLVVFLRAGRRG